MDRWTDIQSPSILFMTLHLFIGEAFDVSVSANLCEDLYKELLTCQSALVTVYANLNEHSNAIAAAEELRSLPEKIYSKLSKNNFKENANCENVAQKLKDYAGKHDSVVFYYSVHSRAIFQWLITPDDGVCDFSCQNIDINNSNNQSEETLSHENGNLLCHLLNELRHSMGLESPQFEESTTSEEIEHNPPCQEDPLPKSFDVVTSQSMEFKIFHRLIQAQLDMTASKNVSVLGVNKTFIDFPKNTKSPLYALHAVLIGKMQEKIAKYASKQPLRRLIFIVEGELVTVPFSLLKRRPNEPYLSQQFTLQCVNSANDLFTKKPKSQFNGQYTRAVVIGNQNEDDDDGACRASQDEADMVSTLLGVEPMYGKTATKNAVLHSVMKAECLHFSCQLSETQPYRFYLSPNRADHLSVDEPVSSNSTDSGLPLDNKSDFETNELKLTPKDIRQRSLAMDDVMKLNLSNTKVVVLGSAHILNPETSSLKKDSKTTQILTSTRSFFNAGAAALVYTLWPVPETTCKLFTESFYSRLLGGKSTCDALSESIDILRKSEQFEHPSYWASFILSGQNVTLDPKNISLYHAMKLLLESDCDKMENIIKLVLHLIDKALERIRSQSNTTVPMYASQVNNII